MNSNMVEASLSNETYEAWFARRAQSGLDRLSMGVERVYTDAEWSKRRVVFEQKMTALKLEHETSLV